MKIYLSVFAIFFALDLAECAESIQDTERLIVVCSKETGADFKALFKGPPNFDDPKIKCLSACLMKNREIMADGKVLIEKTIEFTMNNRPNLVSDTIKADVTECADKANEGKDECEVGGGFDKCMMENFSNKHK